MCNVHVMKTLFAIQIMAILITNKLIEYYKKNF